MAEVFLGVLFRLGRVRGVARYYFMPELPYFARHMAFLLIPGGVMFLLFSAAGFLSRAERGEDAIIAFIAGSVAGIVMGIAWIAPPQ